MSDVKQKIDLVYNFTRFQNGFQCYLKKWIFTFLMSVRESWDHLLLWNIFTIECKIIHIICWNKIVKKVQCTVYSVQWTVYSVQCTVYSVQWTVYRVPCTVYSVPCTVYSVLSRMFDVLPGIVRWKLVNSISSDSRVCQLRDGGRTL